MAKRSGGGAFFFGSVIGGAIGAVIALWKTPQSGQELRDKLGLEGKLPTSAPSFSRGSGDLGTSPKVSLADKALGLVERATAPLVGVKLGQTANNSQPGMSAVTTPSATTTEVSSGLTPPGAGVPVMPAGSK